MPSGLMCIECRFVKENEGILKILKAKTHIGQVREIVGGKSSSFTPPLFEYFSISHTSLEYK